MKASTTILLGVSIPLTTVGLTFEHTPYIVLGLMVLGLAAVAAYADPDWYDSDGGE